MENLQPVQEVSSELASRRERLQAGIGRGDDAYIGVLLGSTTQRAVLMILKEPEEGDLRANGQGVDLIEEQRSSLSERDETQLVVAGVGKCAPPVAEQFIFDERIG